MERQRRLPGAVAAATVVGLLLVVALAAGGRTPLSGERGDVRPLPVVFWDYVLSIGVVLFVVAAPVSIWLLLTTRVTRDPRAGKRRSLSVLVFVGLLCGGLVLASWLSDPDAVRRLPSLPTAETTDTTETGGEDRAPRFRWLPVLVAGGMALLLAGYVAVRQRRRLALEASEETLVDELASLLEDTLEDLREEPDPRRAVIAAYARMERALGAYGLPRQAFESPVEYLQRLAPELNELPGTARLVFELTHLFERAKFSAHVVDAEMKENAIATLLSLRAELLEAA
jgi:Domain of unknown function (DUF4129)